MLSQEFIHHIANVLGCNIQSIRPLSGGNICDTYIIVTATSRFFIKTSTTTQAVDMLTCEKNGLEAIADTKTIATPKIIGNGVFNHIGYLILIYIPSKTPTAKDFELFGSQLAQLHQTKSYCFGCTQNNFIGSLTQNNTQNKDWTTFYITQRLLPQLKLSVQQGVLTVTQIPNLDTLYHRCTHFFENITPSLLHGDLWSGNYLISENGTPYLIDPASYYGHGYVDIAMSKLFGGFNLTFYKAYEAHHTPSPSAVEQQDLYQLYYLLAHLNLFGKSYLPNVLRILKRYF